MQHTKKYQLNLIDPSDEFLPEPLNQNMEAVEAQLQAREAAEKALDSKFTAAGAALQAAIGAHGQTCRVAWGSVYRETGSLEFDFKPVVLFATTGVYGEIMFRPFTDSISMETINTNWGNVTWTDHSVSWTSKRGGGANTTYHYVALGVDE